MKKKRYKKEKNGERIKKVAGKGPYNGTFGRGFESHSRRVL